MKCVVCNSFMPCWSWGQEDFCEKCQKLSDLIPYGGEAFFDQKFLLEITFISEKFPNFFQEDTQEQDSWRKISIKTRKRVYPILKNFEERDFSNDRLHPKHPLLKLYTRLFPKKNLSENMCESINIVEAKIVCGKNKLAKKLFREEGDKS